MIGYTYGAVTDRGDVRKENQDSILCLTESAGMRCSALFAVADGMGGLSYGASVSQYITKQFERWWKEDFADLVQNEMDREEEIRELMEQEIWDINQSVLHFNRRMKCRSGSTLSLMLLHKGRCHIENIGDSRVYRMRAGSLCQLTQDQSLAASMVRERGMTEEQVRRLGMKNKLTMCIGMFEKPESCYMADDILAGDQFLLCSDGLYNELDQEKMADVLASGVLTLPEKAVRMRRMIRPGHASDNVSVIIAAEERKSR